MRTSEAIDQISAALSAAQGAFKNPERNREVTVTMKTGKTYKFAYATLDCIIDMARQPMSSNGLAIVQPARVQDGRVIITTRLLHASGQWIEDELDCQPAFSDPQSVGSAITYMRRYGLCSMLSIFPDEDDDGTHANDRVETATVRPNTKHPVEPPKTAETSTYVIMQEKILEHSGNDARLAEMAEWIGDATKNQMTQPERDRLIAKIVRARKALEAVAEPALRN